MIRLENVSKTYQLGNQSVQALSHVNLQVEPGKIFGVIGKSGAGKSTLIRCVNLLERPTDGKVWVANQEMTALSSAALRSARKQIGMIFQHFNLLTTYTVYDNIALPLRLSHMSHKEIKTRIDRLLTLTGLTDRQHAYPSQLSGGQKQRVAIARALANQPQVLLCDEATSSLDPNTTRSILSLLRDINRELGLTILLITHEMDVIKRLCDTVAVISDGKIIEQNSIIQLFTRPQHALTKTLVHTAFHEVLPEYWANKLQTHPCENHVPLLRLIFSEDSAKQPVVTELSRLLGIPVNILEAHMEMIQGHTVGGMLLTLQDDRKQGDSAVLLQRALDFLKTHQVMVEVLGYVHITD